ncbi:unnamed protein product [Pocillopora meandrina]|uniref:Pacifastin domain-containing protein n=1 Tax=Pocillopora meandrina TaxID=46732 RepID=A0AAU9WJT9_9CNID|nr:unnamed protein product [Pocillopora meandrina]
MRTLLFICGILLFASFTKSSVGNPVPSEAEAGACSVENKEWQIGCDHCYCRNQSVFCETDPGCEEKK